MADGQERVAATTPGPCVFPRCVKGEQPSYCGHDCDVREKSYEHEYGTPADGLAANLHDLAPEDLFDMVRDYRNAPSNTASAMTGEQWAQAAERLGYPGMVTVWDEHGRIVGCMGVELWRALLIARVELFIPESGDPQRLALRQHDDDLRIAQPSHTRAKSACTDNADTKSG